MRHSRRGFMILGLGGIASLVAACGGAQPAAPTTAPTKPAAATTAPAASTPAAATTPGATVAATKPAAATTPATAATKPASAATTPAAAASPAASPAAKASGALTVYSGRSKTLVEPLFEQFGKDTGIQVNARYGDSAELAAAIMEEGRNSPADLFFSQDAGALGAVSERGMLSKLPDTLLTRVDPRFRSDKSEWVGLSGRARVVVYNTNDLKVEDLPDTVQGFTDSKWQGKLGWPPTNASFQAFITAMRLLDGEAAAKQWLQGLQANGVKTFNNNTAIVEAVGKGEIQAGFVNHYYLHTFIKEQGESFPARNYHPRGGGAGSIINVAGAGILTTAKNPEAARTFTDYMLGTAAQQFFADRTFEYPLVPGIKTNALVTPLSEIKTPNLDLSQLSDLEATLNLLREVGAL